jgi:hypothetical protein
MRLRTVSEGPYINDQFPIKGHLSPPVIRNPVYECSEAIYVTSFIPHATIRVYSNITELLAESTPEFGFTEINLNRCVKEGESLTATQTVNTETSQHSIQPVLVSAIPENLVKTTKPEVGKKLFECGIVVPVGNLVPGTRVHVTENALEIGNEPTANSWHPVVTTPLHASRKVSARQIACESCAGSSHTKIVGPKSEDVTVQPAPSPVPSPLPIASSLIPGNDTVTLSSLLVGAGVKIFDHSSLVSSGWFATSDNNYFPISPPLSSSSSISATQELCGVESNPSDSVHPSLMHP